MWMSRGSLCPLPGPWCEVGWMVEGGCVSLVLVRSVDDFVSWATMGKALAGMHGMSV
jgi:hypothetical protein